eukprot:TRINITY_DN3607_c0_g1_i2.p1 TRINITY_DN3607_c0_g1~~TRINITY_DN3607_c0_g1_i2.p1  ORF type:complete len:184 (+),score=24.35 TRINITY_DN3607_c0_g1_i2:34-552(+)
MAGRIVKMLLVGDSQVGKTCMMRRFVDDSFVAEYVSTIGVDFSIRLFSDPQNPDVPPAKLQIWDTAGQERFRTITSAYYRGSHIVFLVYNATQRETYERIDGYWLDEIKRFAAEDVTVAVIGVPYIPPHTATQRRTATTRGSACSSRPAPGSPAPAIWRACRATPARRCTPG